MKKKTIVKMPAVVKIVKTNINSKFYRKKIKIKKKNPKFPSLQITLIKCQKITIKTVNKKIKQIQNNIKRKH